MPKTAERNCKERANKGQKIEVTMSLVSTVSTSLRMARRGKLRGEMAHVDIFEVSSHVRTNASNCCSMQGVLMPYSTQSSVQVELENTRIISSVQ